MDVTHNIWGMRLVPVLCPFHFKILQNRSKEIKTLQSRKPLAQNGLEHNSMRGKKLRKRGLMNPGFKSLLRYLFNRCYNSSIRKKLSEQQICIWSARVQIGLTTYTTHTWHKFGQILQRKYVDPVTYYQEQT